MGNIADAQCLGGIEFSVECLHPLCWASQPSTQSLNKAPTSWAVRRGSVECPVTPASSTVPDFSSQHCFVTLDSVSRFPNPGASITV